MVVSPAVNFRALMLCSNGEIGISVSAIGERIGVEITGRVGDASLVGVIEHDGVAHNITTISAVFSRDLRM